MGTLAAASKSDVFGNRCDRLKIELKEVEVVKKRRISARRCDVGNYCSNSTAKRSSKVATMKEVSIIYYAMQPSNCDRGKIKAEVGDAMRCGV